MQIFHDIRFLILIRPVKDIHVDIIFLEEFSRSFRGIYRESFLYQHPGRIQQLHFGTRGTRGNQDILLRDTMSHGKHALQYCLVIILSDATDFPGRRHIHSQHRVGFQQAGKRELRGLHSHVIQIKNRFVQRLHFLPQHNPGCHVNKVVFQHFRHERETPRSPQVTLDYFYIIVFRQKLHIKRTGYIQFPRYRPGNLFNPANRFHVQFLGGKHNCSVTGMYTGKLHVFTDSVSFHLPFLCHGVNLDLFRLLDKLRYNHGMLFRYFHRQLKEMQ